MRSQLPANILLAAILTAAPSLPAQEAPAGTAGGELQTGKILSVQAHEEGRVFDWVSRGRVPIYDHYPFYDLTIQVRGTNYVVRYESQTGYYPSAWKPGNLIRVRPGHGRLYLLRYDGEEVPASIIRSYR